MEYFLYWTIRHLLDLFYWNDKRILRKMIIILREETKKQWESRRQNFTGFKNCGQKEEKYKMGLFDDG